MSMLSSECDKLRRTAYDLDMIANAIRSGVPARTWHGMTYVFDDGALLMRRAADTIWELRNKLAGMVDQSERIAELEDENARLRSCLSDDAENARQIMDENAKLRNMLALYIRKAYIQACDKGNPIAVGIIEDDARELGIEVE